MKSVGECWSVCVIKPWIIGFLSPVVLSFIEANLQLDLLLPTSLLLPSYVAALNGDAHQERFCSHFFPLWDLRSIHESKRTITLLLYI